MKTQTVYIEVPVSERLPEDNETKFVKTTLTEWESASFEKDHWDGDLRGDFDNPELVTHWLEKKEDQIVMSREEYIKTVSLAMDKAVEIGNSNTSYDKETESTELDISYAEKEIQQYLTNLIK